MNWREIFSCWVSRSWSCPDSAEFKVWADALSAWAGENGWITTVSTTREVRFRRGARLLFSFDYTSGRGEVQLLLRRDPYRELMELRVGNSGFPFEARLSRPHYARQMDALDQALQISERAEKPTDRVRRMERLTRPLALLARERPPAREAADRIFTLITDYGSETPDNVQSARQLTLVRRRDKTGIGVRSGRLLSGILNEAESCDPPPELLANLPGLRAAEWSAALRLCTLLLTDLESHEERKEWD